MKYAFLDLDDTVNCTRSIMVQLLIADHNYTAPENIYLTPDNTSGVLSNILDSGEFMKLVSLNLGFTGLFAKLITTPDLRTCICTHRGYHKKGREFTHQYLDNVGISDYLDEVIVLDPSENPNKVDFIKSKMNLKEDEFFIVDDKPNFFSDKPLGSNTILFDQYWNRNITTYSPSHRITSLAMAIPLIDQLVKDR